MIRVGLLLLCLAAPAAAQTARVASGEHDGFTRLVVQLPAPTGWTVGRTSMGYAFATDAPAQPIYDLATVWNRIARRRLQALRVDPESGSLQLTLACSCHVLPFEYQPGMIVLDIRDGPPPPGSAFEVAFAPDRAAGAAEMAVRPPAPEGYDWLAVARVPKPQGTTGFPLATLSETVTLDPLRDKLLEQISRGAAEGVVDMHLPGKPPKVTGTDAEIAWARVRIGDMPGLGVLDASRDVGVLQPDGTACIPDADLTLSAWGGGRQPADLLAEARSGLYGEFDKVMPDAVLQAVRAHLFLGFGAEARQYAALLSDPGPDLLPLLSMTRLIDGELDPETPFAPMLGCDGAAALWAALAHDRLPAGKTVNGDAIVRSFLALPPHLRRDLGAGLAERLLPRDADGARMIRDAMERTPDVPGATVALLDARSHLHAGRTDQARIEAEAAVSQATTGDEALIALVEAHFQSSRPLSPQMADDLQSLKREIGPSDALDRALVLALALSGNIPDALSLAEPGKTTADLWHVVAKLADNDTLLSHGVLSDASALPRVAPGDALAMADRLLGLGFPDAALVWLEPVGQADPADRRQLAAAAELARGDARQALAYLADIAGAEADLLRARAQTQLGSLDAARLSLEAAGLPQDAARLAIWEADWSRLATEAADPWATAAALARGASPPEVGPLAQSAALLEESASARAALSTLLAAVPSAGP